MRDFDKLSTAANNAGKTTIMILATNTGSEPMNDQAQTAATRSAANGTGFARAIRGLALMSIVALLAACSSGDGGTDVTIGSGQSSGGGAGGSTGGDPVTVDYPVFYVKRPAPDPEDEDVTDDPRKLLRFEIGADLYTRPTASPSSPETNITQGETQGLGDVRDVDVNFDGTKVVFAMRARFIEDADEADQPTWNI